MNYFKSVIIEKSIKPVLNVYICNTMFLTVEFSEYKIIKKINQDLRTFFCIIKKVNINKIIKDKKYCISQPIGFYDIFGITAGDVIEFSNEDVVINVYFTNEI